MARKKVKIEIVTPDNRHGDVVSVYRYSTLTRCLIHLERIGAVIHYGNRKCLVATWRGRKLYCRFASDAIC